MSNQPDPKPLTTDQMIENAEHELEILEHKLAPTDRDKERRDYLHFEIDMLKRERTFLEADEWGIDLRPIVKERLNPPETIDDLDDKAVKTLLHQLLDLLAQYHLNLEETDHLDDRELYQEIMTKIIKIPLGLEHPAIGEMIHHECCNLDDLENYLKYYADEDEREDLEIEWSELYDKPIPQPAEFKTDRYDLFKRLTQKYQMQPIPE